MKNILIIILLICSVFETSAQTVLFSEDFEDENVGDVTGTSAEGIAWTATCPDCAAGDIFAVDDSYGTLKGLRGNDTNGPAEFVANGIDATGMYIIILEFDYESIGYQGSGNLECDSECSGCSGDPADVVSDLSCNNCWDYLLWNLSTGTFNDGGMVLGDDCSVNDNDHVVSNPGCSSPYDQNGDLIPGNDPSNLAITIEMAMWAADENMVIDNIVITGYTKAEAIDAGLMDSAGEDDNLELCGDSGNLNLFDELNGSPSTGGDWTGPSTTSGGYLGTVDLSTVSDGVYEYVVSTGSGCQDTASVTINTNSSGPTVTVSGDMSICNESSTTITVSGADTYQWSDMSVGNTFTTSTTGDYYVEGTSSCGVDTAFFTINSNGTPPSGELSGNQYTCEANSSTSLTISGGDSYSWSTGNTTTTETYNTGESGYVIVSTSCGTDSIPFEITDESVNANFINSDNNQAAPMEVTFTNQSTNATSYSWDFGDGNSGSEISPVHIFNESSTYLAVLTASNELGCLDSDTIAVNVLPNEKIVVPNVFTPNGDKSNEDFGIWTSQEVEIEYVLLNRWGNVVKEGIIQSSTSEFNKFWDGKINDQEASEGTYFYKIDVVFPNLVEKQYQGFFQLIR